jgi:hypothetical protein
LNDLLEPEPRVADGRAGKALGRWARVPAAEAYDSHPSQLAPVPRRTPLMSVKARV